MTLIHVTKEDIDAGREGSCCYCPVALALNRTFPNLVSFVTGPHASLHDETLVEDKVWEGYLPASVQWFVSDFDCNQPVSPFSFELPYEGVSK